MNSSSVITVFPKNEKQQLLLSSLFKELKVDFKIENIDGKKLSKEEYIKKINTSIQQAKSGKVKRITKENQKEFLGL